MQTPYYEFDLNKVQENLKILHDAVQPDSLFYALKANSEMEILKTLRDCNANFEIASIGEYLKLKKIGVNLSNIICSLPIKTEEMISFLYNEGVRYFVFEDFNEYVKLSRLASKAKKILRVDITHFSQNSIEYGMTEKDLQILLNQGNMSIDNIDGITFYLAKNNDVNTILSVLTYCEKIIDIIGNNKILNIGGNYRLPQEVGADYYEQLQKKLNSIRSKYGYVIYMEPGRSIVKSAGKLVTKIIDIKEDKHQIFLDSGLPTGISYCPNCIINVSETIEIPMKKYDFFDITCSHRLLFSTELSFQTSIGDILEFLNFGSYSICKSSNFHGWETPQCTFIRRCNNAYCN